MSPRVECAGCGGPVDLSVPHVAVVRQLEVVEGGSVRVIRADAVSTWHAEHAPSSAAALAAAGAERVEEER